MKKVLTGTLLLTAFLLCSCGRGSYRRYSNSNYSSGGTSISGSFTNSYEDPNSPIPPVGPTTDLLEFREEGNGYYVSGCDESATIVNIPETFNAKRVIGIEANAFEQHQNLLEVYIPNTIEKICNGAFLHCHNLQSAYIPDSVKIMEGWAFEGCFALRSIRISNSITNLGQSTFNGCELLREINIPSSVQTLEYGVFEGCRLVTNVTIPSSVTSIGEACFAYCTNLQRIYIPDSVSRIQTRVFEDDNKCTIYCQSSSKKSGWVYDWNCGRPVVWNS